MFFNENLPIYIQIMNMVKKRIVIKELKEGEKLPSVRELSTELKVNPNTIQRSYQELEREDLVFTQRGMGTFVTEDIDVIDNLKKTMALGLVDSFIKDMESLGFS
ncbi:MAG: GntR family transcriptional regulator, partial [Tissierellaceae bacterium]